VADAYLSVSPLLARTLPLLFARRQRIVQELRERIAGNRARLARAVAGNGLVSILPAEAGWAAIVRIARGAGEPPDEEALTVDLLEHAGVLVQPGFLFDLAPEDAARAPCAHLVLSLLPEPDALARGVEALLELVAGR
jgi:aspartate/methionine/tyrosine aminotransferase